MKDCHFPIVLLLHRCGKSNSDFCDSVSELSFLVHRSICMSIWYYIVLITVALSSVLKLDSFTFILFLSRIVLSSLVSVLSHIEFRLCLLKIFLGF